MIKRAYCLGALALLMAPPVAAQQVSAELSAFGGLYLPVTDVSEMEEAILDELGLLMGVELDKWTGKHKAGLALGGRVDLWFTEAFGIEGTFVYAFSSAETEISGSDAGVPFSESADTSAYVWLASLKGLYRFRPQDGFNIHIGGGLALISRGGNAYDYLSEGFGTDIEGLTDIGAVVNVGATFDVAKKLAIRFDVEDYIYPAKPDLEGADVDVFKSKLQLDLMLTGGLVVRLGG